MMNLRYGTGLWLFCMALSGVSTLQAGTSNSLMDLSSDGTLLACSNRDSGTVTLVELPSLRKKSEIAVGSHPEGVSFLGDSHQLAVAVYGEDRVCFIDGDRGEVLGNVDVADEPYGVVSSADGSKIWVTLEYPGEVIRIDTAERKVQASAIVGKFPRGIALLPSGSLLITEYLTGVVKKLDAESLGVTEEWVGSAQDNLARQITVHPRRDKAYLPMQRSLTNVAHGAGSIFPYLGIVDTQSSGEKRRKRVQMDSFRGTYVVANPWEVAVSPDGKELFIIFSGTNDLFICSVIDDDYVEVEYSGLLRTGWNPRAIKVSPDGKTFYVYNALDFTIDAFSTQFRKPVGQVEVTSWPGTEEELLGKKLFYTAHPPMTSQRWISCSSCHPDGDADGRTWQQPEGLRSTQPLFGLRETHPIHWSADRDEVQDFEHTIRSPLMQGRGLIRGEVHDSLGEPNAGRSKELDALAAYTNSHRFSLSPHAKKGLTESARRGKELFFSNEVGCAKCHSGAYYTDRQLHDVGTGNDDLTEKIGPSFDTPTLLGIYRSAPYLHHGKAETLVELLTKFNPRDQHGSTSQLNADQINDLVEFLKMLPYETP
ncbi:hypothetical protein SH661x_000531 [Planctomicrobium sp. SH661]|uniref:hypothetical protein n=1 Tax=Planctomicrobium sp. SH661 TaxID=3448124 RepID=UPI003F5AE92F